MLCGKFTQDLLIVLDLDTGQRGFSYEKKYRKFDDI